MNSKLVKNLGPQVWWATALRLGRIGLPPLAALSVAMTLYLAPTKDGYANILVFLLGVVVLVSRRFQAHHLAVLKGLLPLGLLGLYALLLQHLFPKSNAETLIDRLLLGAMAFWICYYVFATMRLGRRYLWLFFLFVVPAAVHLLYMYTDIASSVIGLDSVDFETLKDMPRVGRRYLSHVLVPLLVTTMLLGARVRPQRWLPLVFLAGIGLPAISLALLDARAAYISILGATLVVLVVPPLRREFQSALGLWSRRMRWYYPLLLLVLTATALTAYSSGKSRWSAMVFSFAAAVVDVRSGDADRHSVVDVRSGDADRHSIVDARSGDADRHRKPPFADKSYWNQPIKERCAENKARCWVDQSMYLRTAWLFYAVGQLKEHPFGAGQKRALMSFDGAPLIHASDGSANTAGDNFIIEAAMAFGFVGLALYGWLWCSVIRSGVMAVVQAKRKAIPALLVTLIGICIIRSFVDVVSYGLWYYWMAMVGVMYGCIQNEGRVIGGAVPADLRGATVMKAGPDGSPVSE